MDAAALLIGRGADVNAKDAIEDTPFLYAGAEGRTAILTAILAAGAKLGDTNRYGGTALIPAAGTTWWIGGQTTNNWGAGAPPGAPTNPADFALSYSFDTPVGAADCGTANGHGRVIFNGMHVNQTFTGVAIAGRAA